MLSKTPRLVASHILVDIDGTVTGVRNCPSRKIDGRVDYAEVFRSIWHEYHPGSKETAPVPPESECLFSFASRTGVPGDVLWNRLLDHHRAVGLQVFPDARELLVRLRQHGVVVCSATTNPRMMTLAKLAVADMADADGSPFFDRFFGGDLIREGKSSGRFFETILGRLEVPPDAVLMVGDEFSVDAEFALAVGITQVVIVDRKSRHSWRRDSKGILVVNDLTVILEWLSTPHG